MGKTKSSCFLGCFWSDPFHTFGQIPPLTTELAALERLKNRCHHVISVDIDPIFFKLAGNKDMHNIMNELKYLKIIRVPNKDMHKSLQEFDFWHIQTADIVELIGPEKTIALLLENYSKYINYFTWWLSGERSLPFGLLVYWFCVQRPSLVLE